MKKFLISFIMIFVMMAVPVCAFDKFQDVFIKMKLENVVVDKFEVNEIPGVVSIPIDTNLDGKVDLIIGCHYKNYEPVNCKNSKCRLKKYGVKKSEWILRTNTSIHQYQYVVDLNSCYFFKEPNDAEWKSTIFKTYKFEK